MTQIVMVGENLAHCTSLWTRLIPPCLMFVRLLPASAQVTLSLPSFIERLSTGVLARRKQAQHQPQLIILFRYT